MINKSKAVILILIILSIAVVGCGKRKVNRLPSHMRPGSPEFLVNNGLIALNAGALNEAEKSFLTAIKKKANSVGALHGLGIVYLKKGDLDRAEKYFRRSLDIKADNVDARNYLGIIYTEQGKYELAKENLLIAANTEHYRTPENAFANLASLEIRYNKFDSAKRYVEMGLEKNKKFAPLLNAYGIILEKEKNYTEAIFYYEQAVSVLGDNDVNYLINLGRVYSKVGQNVKALDVLERALSKANSEAVRRQVREMIRKLNKK